MSRPRPDLPEGTPRAIARLVPELSDEIGLRRLGWVVALVLVASMLAFLARGGQRPADPVLVETSRQSLFDGFDQIALRVDPVPTDPDAAELAGAVYCMLLADTPELRAQGFQQFTGLGGYDGMVFVFNGPTVGEFHMRNVTIPLAIAFVDADGVFISSRVMDPCPKGDDSCPTYGAKAPFTAAVEVPRGKLVTKGIVAGSRVDIGGACPAPPPGSPRARASTSTSVPSG